MGCFNVIVFLTWIISLVMLFVDYHLGWMISFVITTLYFIIVIGLHGGVAFDIDIDF